MVASRWPHSLPFAATFISRSTSSAVRYSRGRRAALATRRGDVVPFTIGGPFLCLGSRGKRPGRDELTRLRRSGPDPTCPGHVGFGEDRPFGPATRRAGGAGRGAAGRERRPEGGGRRAAGRGRDPQGREAPARGEAQRHGEGRRARHGRGGPEP